MIKKSPIIIPIITLVTYSVVLIFQFGKLAIHANNWNKEIKAKRDNEKTV